MRRWAKLALSGAVAAGLAVSALPALAQAARDTVLILDSSGSMWGRVIGKPKVEAAREAVGELVAGLPDGTRLGIVAYGHRRAGDCRDIETLVPLGPLDRARALAAAARIVPRGKTPITGALEEAARLIDPARGGAIVLLTDGIETCAADPCAAAAALKARNASLAVHVVGFDIPNRADRARIACIAERTGGTFVSADNARELAEALRRTAQAAPRPVAPRRAVALRATEGGRTVADAVFAVRQAGDGTIVAEGVAGRIELPPGRYRVSAGSQARTGSVEAQVTASAPSEIVVPLTGSLPKATLTLPQAPLVASGRAEIGWTGPNAEGDYIAFVKPDGTAGEERQYAYAREGSPARIRVPGEPGAYELRYVHPAGGGAILARATVEVAPATASLDAPAQAVAGTEIAVAWTGPGAEEDWIGVAPAAAVAADYSTGWTPAGQGSPVRLRLPANPGTYELRYVSGLDPRVLAARPIRVLPAQATLEAAGEAMAGSMLPVVHRGPSGGDTFVGILKPGDRPGDYIGGAWARPEDGPMALHVPGEPGAYELRYVLQGSEGHTVLVSRPLAVTPPVAGLKAAPTAKAGEKIRVEATGPRGNGDFVTIVAPSDEPGAYTDYFNTPETLSGELTVPDQPGSYEIRYVMQAPLTDSRVIARVPLTVE